MTATTTKITLSLATLNEQALDGLSYHPEAGVRLAAATEIGRRAESERKRAEALLEDFNYVGSRHHY